MRYTEPVHPILLQSRPRADRVAELESFSLMTRLLHALVVLVAVVAVSCGRPTAVPWKDGNFKVYATDEDFNSTRLGYDHHPGLLGLVEDDVIAAGSTAQFVFVERLDRASNRTEFYVVSKEVGDSHSGNVEGPFSEAQFRDIRASRKLPGFTWRKKG